MSRYYKKQLVKWKRNNKKKKYAKACIGCIDNKEGYCLKHKSWCSKVTATCENQALYVNKNTSSGEIKVKEYLNSIGIPYKTQRKTIKCINPKTNNIMPYDYELKNKKIIIEIHGEQHYRFIKHFHKTEYEFKEHQWRDKYKKDYAISKGYDYIEISYNDFKDNKYIDIIQTAIQKYDKENHVV